MNLDGPVRVADTAGSGTATVTLSFDNWKGAKVAPTTHTVTVLAAKKAAKVEPVASALVATLVHPDRKASILNVAFSADGKRLFASGYPSGVVQIFDVAARKEVQRIETPLGSSGTVDDALLSPDWKALYVPFVTRKTKSAEVSGKQVTRAEFSGAIRVWDPTTGEETAPLRPPAGSGPVFARLSPDGRSLVCLERPSFNADGRDRPKDVTVIWDLTARTRRKLADGLQTPVFTPDGKTLALQYTDAEANRSTVRVVDAATFKERAKFENKDEDRKLSLDGVSPDGSVLAASLGGKKGAPREVLFLSAKTLEGCGRFVGAGDPEQYGWGESRFTPDGKFCVILGVPDKVVVWDVAGKKVARTFDLGAANSRSAFSPDGKTLAVSWLPKFEGAPAPVRDPDPQDYPQLRVTAFDLAGTAAPKTFVSRHGFVGGLAFSPDGRTLAVGSSGGVHLFGLTK